jgi:hypothetical protein
MRRVIVSVVLAGTLAVPAVAVALSSTVYGGGPAYVTLKGQHKQKLAAAGVTPGVTLQCDEGKTTTGTDFYTFPHPKPALKTGRQFEVNFPTTLVFQILDDQGYVVGTTRDEFVVRIQGRFKKNYRSAKGTFRMSGSYGGPTGPPYFESPQYHNCDSGTVHWKARKGAPIPEPPPKPPKAEPPVAGG